MTTHAPSRTPDEPHGHAVATPHHQVPYILVFITLLVLTGTTVAIAFSTFPTELVNVVLALAVAILKGSLVALFFMHLKFEGKLIYIIFIVPLILCVLLLFALIPDIIMTGPNSNSASLHLFNPPAIPK